MHVHCIIYIIYLCIIKGITFYVHLNLLSLVDRNPLKVIIFCTKSFQDYGSLNPAKLRRSLGDILKIGNKSKKSSDTSSVLSSGSSSHYYAPSAIFPQIQQQQQQRQQEQQLFTQQVQQNPHYVREYYNKYGPSGAYSQPVYATPNNNINGTVNGHTMGYNYYTQDAVGYSNSKGNTVRYTDWFGSVATRRPNLRPEIPSFAPPQVEQQSQQQYVAITVPQGVCVCPTTNAGTARAKRKKKCKMCGHKTINLRHTLTLQSTIRSPVNPAIYSTPIQQHPIPVAVVAPAPARPALWGEWGTSSHYAVAHKPPLVPSSHLSDEDSNPPTPETVRSVRSSDSTVTLTRELPEMVNDSRRKHRQQQQQKRVSRNNSDRILATQNLTPSAYNLLKPSSVDLLSSDTDDLSDNAVDDPVTELSNSQSLNESVPHGQKSLAFQKFQASRDRGRRVSIISIGEETNSDSTNVIKISTSNADSLAKDEESMENSRLHITPTFQTEENHKTSNNNKKSVVVVNNNIHSNVRDSKIISEDKAIFSQINTDQIINQSNSKQSKGTSVSISGNKLVLLNEMSVAGKNSSYNNLNNIEINSLPLYDGTNKGNSEQSNVLVTANTETEERPHQPIYMSTARKHRLVSSTNDTIYEEDEELDKTIEEDIESLISTGSSSKMNEEDMLNNEQDSTTCHRENSSQVSKSNMENNGRTQPTLSELLFVKSILKRPNSLDTSSENDSDFTPPTIVESKLQFNPNRKKSVQFSASKNVTLVEAPRENRRRKLSSPKFGKKDQHTEKLHNNSSLFDDLNDIYARSETENDPYSIDTDNVSINANGYHHNSSRKTNEISREPNMESSSSVSKVKLRNNSNITRKDTRQRHSVSGIPIADMSVKSGYSHARDISNSKIAKLRSTEELRVDGAANRSSDIYAGGKQLVQKGKSSDLYPNSINAKYNSNWLAMFENANMDRYLSNVSVKNKLNNNQTARMSKLPSPVRSIDAYNSTNSSHSHSNGMYFKIQIA